MWVKALQSRCITQFGKAQVKVISPQSFLVDGICCHVKDLHPCHSPTIPEEDSNGTSESGAESLLHDNEDVESDNSLKEQAKAEHYFCEEVPIENNHCQVAIFVILRSKGVNSKRNCQPQSLK